jgi:hypothetical protein
MEVIRSKWDWIESKQVRVNSKVKGLELGLGLEKVFGSGLELGLGFIRAKWDWIESEQVRVRIRVISNLNLRIDSNPNSNLSFNSNSNSNREKSRES